MEEMLARWVQGADLDPLTQGVLSDWMSDFNPRSGELLRGSKPWLGSAFAPLVGRKILSVRLLSRGRAEGVAFATGVEGVIFSTSEGDVALLVDGDCCSDSWMYRITGVASLMGRVVLGVLETPTDDVNPNDGLGRQEEDLVYGAGLLTEAGVCEIVFRNSSNGYYGGYWERWGKTIPPEWLAVEPLADDWQYSH